MSDYIGRETLIGKVEKHYCAPCKGQGGDLGGDWCRSCVINSVLEKVRGIPAADVVPVAHGEWIERALRPTCSLCGFSGSLIDAPISPFKYCPNCGAKMDKTGG
jgi:hypothetical protein